MGAARLVAAKAGTATKQPGAHDQLNAGREGKGWDGMGWDRTGQDATREVGGSATYSAAIVYPAVWWAQAHAAVSGVLTRRRNRNTR